MVLLKRNKLKIETTLRRLQLKNKKTNFRLKYFSSHCFQTHITHYHAGDIWKVIDFFETCSVQITLHDEKSICWGRKIIVYRWKCNYWSNNYISSDKQLFFDSTITFLIWLLQLWTNSLLYRNSYLKKFLS